MISWCWGRRRGQEETNNYPSSAFHWCTRLCPPHNGLWLQGKQEEKAKEQP